MTHAFKWGIIPTAFGPIVGRSLGPKPVGRVFIHCQTKEFSSEMAKVLKTAKVKSTTELNDNVLLKLTKNPLADIIV